MSLHSLRGRMMHGSEDFDENGVPLEALIEEKDKESSSDSSSSTKSDASDEEASLARALARAHRRAERTFRTQYGISFPTAEELEG